LDAVQLAFDAAATAVEYRLQYAGDFQERGDPDEKIVRDRLTELAADAPWELQVVELSSGSFKAKLRAVAVDRRTEPMFWAVAALAVCVLSAVLPPVGLIAGVVVAVANVAAASAPKPVGELLAERLATGQTADRMDAGRNGQDALSNLERTTDTAQGHQFEEDLKALSEHMSQIELHSLDRIKALEAEIQELTLTVAKQQAAAPATGEKPHS
jgi:hypothetical protein